MLDQQQRQRFLGKRCGLFLWTGSSTCTQRPTFYIRSRSLPWACLSRPSFAALTLSNVPNRLSFDIGSCRGKGNDCLGPKLTSSFCLFFHSPITTQIMTAPVYIISCIVTIALAFSSDRFSERGYHAAASEALATLGYLLLILTRDSSTASKYVSLVVCAAGVYSYIPIQLSWPSSNVGGHTRKGVAIAFVMSVAQIGSIFGGQLYRADDGKISLCSLYLNSRVFTHQASVQICPIFIAPRYIRGHTICCILLGINTLGNLAIKMLLRRENRRRDRLTSEQYNRECATGGNTDKHPGFRYFE